MSHEFGELLKNEQAHPIILMRGLTKKYGSEWMTWLPSTLRKTLERDFDVAPAKINLNKILAASAVAQQPSFWEHWEHFHFLAQALNNNTPSPLIHKELSVGQMMVAVDIANSIRKDLGKLSFVPEFSEEVARYVAAQAKNDGIWYLPAPLSFAAKYASGHRYKCRDCGNDSEVYFDDGLCDVCTDRWNTASLGGWEPDLSLVSKGWGKNITYYELNPTKKVRTRLEQLVKSPEITLQENSTDVCAAKLLVALQYMGYRRKQLEEQLT
jgi:hypothetical protein